MRDYQYDCWLSLRWLGPPPNWPDEVDSPHKLEISEQPLVGALRSFTEQTGLQVGYEAEIARNVTSPGVQGIQDAEAALKSLLADTGLEFHFINENTVVIRAISRPTKGENGLGKALPALEEIVVTSQKQEQRLRDIPLAVSVTSRADVESFEYSDISDIALHTTGLNWGGSTTKPLIFLRGVGSSDFQSGSHNPVSLYVDGVLLGSSFGVSSLLLDVEHIEVLKGPQGTLWGRNTTAGLIHYISQKAEPGAPLEGSLSLGVAQAGETEISAAVGIPVGDRVALRVAARSVSRGAPFENSNPDFSNDIGGGRWNAVRGNVVAEVTDRLNLDAIAYYGDIDIDHSSPQKNLGVFGNCDNPGVLGTLCEDSGGFINTADFREIFNGFETFERSTRAGASLTLNYSFDSLMLTSVTAYNEVDRISLNDNDGSPSVLSEGNFQDDYRGFSQELRLLPSETTANWEWLVGLYYYQDKLEWYRSSVRETGVSGARFQDTSTETAALFGEVIYDVTDRLQITAGLRITYDQRVANAIRTFLYASTSGVFNSRTQAFANLISPMITIDDVETSWTEPSGRLSGLYRLSENTNLWVNVARGFKGGDPNSGAFVPGEFNFSDPEFVTSVEGGVKMVAAKGALQFNASAYLYDYADKQVFTQIPGSSTVGNLTTLSNAGKLTINGLDFEVNWAPTNNTFLGAGLSYIKAEFDEFLNPGTGEDLRGNVTAFTPELSLDLIARYKWNFANGAAVSVQADVVYSDDIFFTNGNDPLVFQDSYLVWGGNVSYTSPEGRWKFRLWGKNLGDEEYWLGGFNLSERGAILLTPSNPTTVGATLTYEF